jgi:ribonuclease J
MVLAVIGLAQHSGELVAGPELISRGVTGDESGPEVMEAARIEVVAALDGMDPESRTDAGEVQNAVRRALRRHFRRLDRRPVILPFVLEM